MSQSYKHKHFALIAPPGATKLLPKKGLEWKNEELDLELIFYSTKHILSFPMAKWFS